MSRAAQERVRRAALAQVQLDRVGAPEAAVARDTKSIAQRPITPRASSAPTDPGDRRDLARVPGLGREAAAEVALPARAAEQLVVRRHDLDLAVRRDVELHARAAHVGAGDALLDDAADLAEPLEVAVDGQLRASRAIADSRSPMRRSSPGAPGTARPPRSTIAFPRPRRPR